MAQRYSGYTLTSGCRFGPCTFHVALCVCACVWILSRCAALLLQKQDVEKVNCVSVSEGCGGLFLHLRLYDEGLNWNQAVE